MSNDLSNLLKRLKDPNKPKLVVTNRLEGWLAAHPEGILPPTEMAPVVYDLLLRPPTGNRGGSFHSDRMKCERAQVFEFLGMPDAGRGYTPTLQNVFNDGTFRHIRWQLMGLMAGIFTHVEAVKKNGGMYYAGCQGVPLPAETTPVDAMRLGVRADAINLDEGFGAEIKGTRALGYIITNGISTPHLLQMHTYFFAYPELDRWVYLAEDKGSQDWREVVIERDPKLVREVANQLADLNDSVDKKKLPKILPECKEGRSAVFNACPYNKFCREAGTWATKEEIDLVVNPRPKGRRKLDKHKTNSG